MGWKQNIAPDFGGTDVLLIEPTWDGNLTLATTDEFGLVLLIEPTWDGNFTSRQRISRTSKPSNRTNMGWKPLRKLGRASWKRYF
jgi:hypothetical protein